MNKKLKTPSADIGYPSMKRHHSSMNRQGNRHLFQIKKFKLNSILTSSKD